MDRNITPFSRLYGRFYIGSDFLNLAGAIDNSVSSPTGLIDNFDDFSWAGFSTSHTKLSVRGFYENTASYRVLVCADWKPGFKLAGRVFRWFSRRIQQMGLPVDAVNDREMISRIENVNDKYDGRENVRAWIRTYRSTGDTVYVALYARHVKNAIPYLNIAFPMPGGNLTSVLRVDPNPDDPGGLTLSTFRLGDKSSDAGIYFANRVKPFRMPFNETITVWTETNEAVIKARHDIWLFGIHFLAMDYTIEKHA